ncbi:FAD-binding oxidoreductase [Nakamurella silvestris]|nr:FAD-binding oxidoreductase [Nakamurella silvestris]
MTLAEPNSVQPAAPSDTAGTLLTELDAATAGQVFGPGDTGYAAAFAPFNLSTVHQPEVVVVAADAADVAAAVGIAARAGRSVAVQATGHGAAPADQETVLISTRLLDTVTVDPQARTATIGAGAIWQQVLDAAAPYGLAALAGSAPHVGAVGYTLGGGLGPVARTFGLASDHVLGFEVVTAGGEIVTVDARNRPELFWALRGGGAAFGIVTSMTIDLIPLATVFGGGLWFAAEDAPALLHTWRNWTLDLPETITTSIARLNLPPLPQLPEPLRGRAVVHLRFASVGDEAEAAAQLDRFRTIATPLMDTVGRIPYAAIGAVHADPVDPIPAADRGIGLSDLPEAAVDSFLAVTSPAARLPFLVAEIRLLGGAVARQSAVPSAVGGRDAAYGLNAIGALVPPIAEHVPGALEAVLAALTPWSSGGSLINFAGSTGAVADARIQRSFAPEVYRRLVALRAETDPAGVFAASARWSVLPVD